MVSLFVIFFDFRQKWRYCGTFWQVFGHSVYYDFAKYFSKGVKV